MVLGSGEIDILLVVLVVTRAADPAPMVAAVAAARVARPDVPVLLVVVGALSPPAEAVGLSCLPTASRALGAIARTARYSAWRAEPRTDPAPVDVERARHARAAATALLGAQDPDGDGWTDVRLAAALLTPYGLAPPAGQELDDTASDGVEMALGLEQDPAFGPLVSVGAGGTAHALGEDRVVLLPPLDPDAAIRAVRSLHAWPLLCGRPGARTPPVDVGALVALVHSLSDLGTDVPQVAELALDRVRVGLTGVALMEVRLRLAHRPAPDAGVPRRLRPPA